MDSGSGRSNLNPDYGLNAPGYLREEVYRPRPSVQGMLAERLGEIIAGTILPDHIFGVLSMASSQATQGKIKAAEAMEILRGRVAVGGMPAEVTEGQLYDGLRLDYKKRKIYLVKTCYEKRPKRKIARKSKPQ